MNEEHHFTSMLGGGLVADKLRTGDTSFKPKRGTWCTNPTTNSAANIFLKSISEISLEKKNCMTVGHCFTAYFNHARACC